MGEKIEFQPLTREDKITVVLYRTGIVLSTVIIAVMASLALKLISDSSMVFSSRPADILGYCLYVSVGISVFFIHLYIGKFKVFLKNVYYVSLACLVLLLALGKGSLSGEIVRNSYSAMLLLPISGCLGFVTAKEAFCFKLLEGYLLAMIMPIYLLLVAGNILTLGGKSYGLVLIAALLVLFTLRKVFMPIAWDIGDKSAYQ